MSLPQFDPMKTLNELRESRRAREESQQSASSKVASEVSLGVMEARSFIDKAFSWVESELSLEGLHLSYQSSQKEGLERQFLISLSSHLDEGMRALKREQLHVERDLKDEEKLSRLVVQDYLLEVALADSGEKLSTESLSKVLSDNSPKEFVEGLKSAALEELSGAANFLAVHSDKKLIQNLTSGKVKDLYSVLDSTSNGRVLKIIEDHAQMSVKWNDASQNHEVHPAGRATLESEAITGPRAEQFLEGVIKRERPLARSVSRYVNPIKSMLDTMDNDTRPEPTQKTKFLELHPMLRMFKP